MNEDKVFIEGHVVGLFADALGRKGKQIKVASGDIVDIDDDFIYKLIGPETGRADEAPRYVKNILARLRELPVHDREVWLKAIMGEFEQDFSHAKWREGYEQGKFEGEWVGNQLKDADKIRRELNKPVIPQFVADWIEVCKEHLTSSLYLAMTPSFLKSNNQGIELTLWIKKNEETFARAWLDGYTVEKEKWYKIEVKGVSENSVLIHDKTEECWFFEDDNNEDTIYVYHTRKELEDAGFGWVFSCEGIEIEEVE